MKKKHLLIVFVISISIFIILVSKGFSQSSFSRVPLPKEIEIKIPSPELPKEIAAFSGKWGGSWQKVMDFIIVVTEINSEKAEVIYAYADTPVWRIRAGYDYYTATVIPGEKPRIEFRTPRTGAWVTFEMQKDLKALKGTYDRAAIGLHQKAVMEKIQ